MRELGDLPVERDRLAAEQQLVGDIAGLERQVEYQTQDLAATRGRIQKMEAEAAALEKVRMCAADNPWALRFQSADILSSSILPERQQCPHLCL